MKTLSFSLAFCLLACQGNSGPTPVATPVATPIATKTVEPARSADDPDLARLAQTAGGTVGVTAVHIESGRRISLNGGERFMMASVFKLPIALTLLQHVDEGRLRLDQTVTVTAADLRVGAASVITKLGVTMTLQELMEVMMLNSDNAACDLLLKQVGGPQVVNDHLKKLGFKDIDVNRTELQLAFDFYGIDKPIPEDQLTLARIEKAFKAVPDSSKKAAERRFEADRRDTSTPDDMAELLVRIQKKSLLAPASAELLIETMKRCKTGQGRLKGKLPPETVVAHKTGSVGRIANDVGIITLPDNAGHVAIAVFVKQSDKPMATREKAIADISRAVYDWALAGKP